MDFTNTIILGVSFLAVMTIWKGIYIVPQQSAWVVEKLGRFNRVLEPGLQFLLPYIERVAYKHSLKEYRLDVQEQTAIARDEIALVVDGIIHLHIVDPCKASYGISDPAYAITQLTQKVIRDEIAKFSLNESLERREHLITNIIAAINHTARAWGIKCMHFEIKNIKASIV